MGQLVVDQSARREEVQLLGLEDNARVFDGHVIARVDHEIYPEGLHVAGQDAKLCSLQVLDVAQDDPET